MSEEKKFLDNEIVVSMSNATYKGEVGPQGPQGEPGLSAYLVAVDNGFIGSEADWLATLVGPQGPQGPQGEPGPAGTDGVIGRDGKSAYEIAVDYGFEGTEEEWIASIGETGPQGPKGDTGDTGPQGPKGDTGATGPKGDTPVKGVDYFTQQDISDIVAQIPTVDLTSYATKTEVETAIRGAETGLLKRSVVQSLPNSNIDDNTIYMVAKTGTTGDVYDEYLYINNAWEHIGSTAVDLTGYATQQYVDNKVADINQVDSLNNTRTIVNATDGIIVDAMYDENTGYAAEVAYLYSSGIAVEANDYDSINDEYNTTSIMLNTNDGLMFNDGTNLKSLKMDTNGDLTWDDVVINGSGTSYTAGSGINIDQNDVISSYDCQTTIPILLSLLGSNTSITGFSSNVTNLYLGATVEDFINGIKSGKVIDVGGSFSANGLGTALNNLGFSSVITIADSGTLTPISLSASNMADWKPTLNWSYWAASNNVIVGVQSPYGGIFGKGISNSLYYNNTTSNLTASTIKGAIDEVVSQVNTKITAPTAPSTDGTYKLTSTISSGSASYAWAADSNSGGSSSSSGGIDIVTYDNYTNYINTTDPFLTISGNKITGLKIVVIKLKYSTTTMGNKRYTYSDDTPADIKQFVYNLYNNQISYGSYDDLENGYMLYFDFIDDNSVRPILCSSVLQRYTYNNNNYGWFMFLSSIQHLHRQDNYNGIKPFDVKYTGIMWNSGWLDQSSLTCQIVKYPISLSNFITPPSTTGTYTLQCNATESSGNKLYTYSWVAAAT